ncbi:trypsin, partial [Saccharothrix longispora]|nr:trypsin [Saccharothrix longispora]
PAPPAPPTPPTPDVARFAADELAALRAATDRAAALARLREAITRHEPAWRAKGEPAGTVRALRDLAAELAAPTTDRAELDRRFRHAVATLEALAAPRGRGPFWKR